jgi:CheY-like chemotaxis protein
MKKRVLIVEDSDIATRSEKRILERLDCEVDCAVTGEEALKKTTLIPYDLILMDVQLPGINGIETAGKIRKEQSEINNSLTPVVAVTADKNQNELAKCLQVGMNEVVCKPFTADKAKSILYRFCSPSLK